MFEFEDIIIAIIFGSIGLLIIILGIYLKIVDHNFKKKGIKLDFKVKSVKTEKQLAEDGEILRKFYITTFEFTHNNELLEEKLQTAHKFKVGTIIPGIYLPKSKLNKISVGGEGFHLSSGAELILIGVGLIILFYVIAALLNFSIKTVIVFTILAFAIVVGKIFILKKVNNNKKK